MNFDLMTGIPPVIREMLERAIGNNGLPSVFGKTYYVDPLNGSNSNGGLAIDNALDDLAYAYSIAIAGDSIILVDHGITSAACTSYLTQPIAWTKNDIIVKGLGARSHVFQRARISNKTKVTTGALTDISFTNSGTADTINRVTGSFITDGFVAGQKIRVDSTSNTNDGVFTVLTVAALTLTLSTGDSLTTEAAVTAGATTVTNYLPYLVNVTGYNNTFANISCFNSDVDVAAIGGWIEGGQRNTYYNCHMVGGAGCAAVATIYSLYCYKSQDAAFYDCTFGTDTVDRGNFANCDILLDGITDNNNYRLLFENCKTIAWVTGGYTAHLAIKSGSNQSIGRDVIMRGCIFNCYMDSMGARQLSMFGGTAPISGYIYMDINCMLAGYAEWAADTANNCVYVGVPTIPAAAAGGIPTVK
jgi:hypothetical protein